MGEIKAGEENKKGIIWGDEFCDLEICESRFFRSDHRGPPGGFRRYDN